jgi:hypothetical protein
MQEAASETKTVRRAIWGLVLVCVALPITFLPWAYALMNDLSESSYRWTTLVGIPIGTAGLLLALIALADAPRDAHRTRRIAMTTVVLGVLGAASATPLIMGAIFRP